MIHDDARPAGQSVPVALGIAQVLGNLRQQHRRGHRLQHSRLLGAVQTAGVHGHEDVGRRLGALAQEPFDQLVGAAFDQVHLDPGLLLEALVEFQVHVVVTMRVDVDLVLARGLGEHGGRRPNQYGGSQQQPH